MLLLIINLSLWSLTCFRDECALYPCGVFAVACCEWCDLTDLLRPPTDVASIRIGCMILKYTATHISVRKKGQEVKN